jgi:transposase
MSQTSTRRSRSSSARALPQRRVVSPDAAGIDLGATVHFVAVPPERDPQPVRSFGTDTAALQALADWLLQCRVRTVAMEATGVYWVPLFQVLEERGLEVCLVNARHVKNVPGRKTDVQDCQWLQYLHAVGLLNASFRPPAAVCAVRALVRHRESLVRTGCEHLLRVQKALDQMNVQVHHVLTDITGVTGTAIVEAILRGERDPKVLAAYRDKRVKAKPETLVAALTGDYRGEHLFCLKQAHAAYNFTVMQIAEVDKALDAELTRLAPKSAPPGSTPTVPPASTPPPAEGSTPPAPLRKVSTKHPPAYSAQESLAALCGVDLTTIPSIHVLTAHTIWAELGSDLSAFPTAKHFSSWLSLCPDNRTSAGQCLSTKTRASANRVAHALRMAAQSCHHAKHELGDYYRRMRAKLGAAEGLVATAHKIARILYAVMTTRRPYDRTLHEHALAQTQRRRIARLHSLATNLGFQLIPNQQTV